MNESKRDCLVSVVCSTYNQKEYIAQCLDSLINQKTDFVYEIIVKDDASTDGQQKIIREYEKKYPNLVIPVFFSENMYSKGLTDEGWEIALKMCKGKYIALCEGDDFWTDNRKLQYQVDFMEKHPDYSLCGHAAYYANEDGSLRNDKYFQFADKSCEVPIEKIFSSWTMATNSILYRTDCRRELTVPYRGKCVNGDFALISYLALNGKVYYMNRIMSAYRINSNGSLTRMYTENLDAYKEKRMGFIEMLDRLDKFTEKKYTEVIHDYKNQCLFDMYLTIGDGKRLKKYSFVAKERSIKIRIRYVFCVYFNWLYLRMRKMVHHIRRRKRV